MTLATAAEPSLDLAPRAGRGTKPRRGRLAAIVAGAAGFVVLVALLYTASVHAFAGNSDGATVVLEGQSMSAGQLMLHGWSLSLDSFWSVDAVFYMLTELVTGMGAMLLYLVPAIIGALVIVVGVVLARDRRRDIAGTVAAATVVAVLAFPGHVLAVFFLQGPLHVCTALWCLIAFAGLRSGRFGWGWLVAVVFFAAGALGDFQMIAFGMAAAFAAGLVAMARARDWRRGFPEISAACAAFALALAIRLLASLAGTFTINAAHPWASMHQMLVNLKHIVPYSVVMLGVSNGSFKTRQVPVPVQAVHVVGLVVLAMGVVVATVELVRGVVKGERAPTPGRRLEDLLVFAFFADLIVFVVFTSSNDPAFMRYLTAAVIFGSILAGRWVGRLAASVESTQLLWSGAVLSVAVVATMGISFGYNVTAPGPVRPFDQLGRFLEAHGLRQGIGDYWSASITTVATDGRVKVRPVVTTPTGRVVRYDRQSTAAWYSHRRFQFLVYNTGRPWGGIDSRTASATFGHVAHTYVIGIYRVLVWDHPLRVSPVGFSPVPVPKR